MNPAVPAELEAEFLRIPAAVKFSGLGRTTLFAAIADGRLKSKCIRQPGAIRGIRLISKQAIRDFIESCEDAPEDRPQSATKSKVGRKPKKGGASA